MSDNNTIHMPDASPVDTMQEKPIAGSKPAPEQKGGVRAWYHDIRSGEKKSVTVGNEPYHDMRYTAHNESEAKAAITGYQNKSLRGKATFSFSITGDPHVMAEAKLVQTPAFRPYIPAEWRIKSVHHRFEPSGGYTTTGDCELFSKSQQNTPENIKKTKPSTDDTIDADAPAEAVEKTYDDDGVIHLFK